MLGSLTAEYPDRICFTFHRAGEKDTNGVVFYFNAEARRTWIDSSVVPPSDRMTC